MHDYTDPVMPGGITGNGRMLCTIRENGMLHRLFWPHIDWGQHMGILKPGLQLNGGPVLWLDGESFTHRQYYEENSSLLNTVINAASGIIEILQSDFVLPDQDVLARAYRLTNTGQSPLNINLIAYCSFSIEESELYDCMYYSPSLHALIQFRRSVYLGLKCLERAPYGFHCGRRNCPSDPFESAGRGEFWSSPDNIKASAGSLGWNIGEIRPGESAPASLIIAAAHSEKTLAELISRYSGDNPGDLAGITRQYWKGWLSPAEKDNPGTKLYSRSLLTLKLLSDKSGGGSVAAPEFDSHYRASGGYGYCWPRDGMYTALALDESGYHQEAEKFYRFAANVQKADGSWHQRYFITGDPAPTWGQQIDQAGAVLWGYHHHYQATGKRSFLDLIWPSVLAGAGFLVKSIRPGGLQPPSMDLWEDEFAQSAYSSAAVYGGLMGAASLAAHRGDLKSEKIWTAAAGLLKKSILSFLWSDEKDSFIKSVNRRVDEWEYRKALDSGETAVVLAVPGSSGSYHAVTYKKMDVALLGLCFPFAVLPPGDLMMQATADSIERILGSGRAGGIHRYEGDTYAGGNPWVLAALWMSLYRSLLGQRERALEYIHWAEVNASPTDLLPEQVDRDRGGPAWVLPLGWSHAMYVLASRAVSGRLSMMNK
ncbi:MAG: glycoside hydrolase family 15 protein [Actinobacteria bacterium]|nr:glycoside hydrolase family 15 protein [Actinomycetota bacterium]